MKKSLIFLFALLCTTNAFAIIEFNAEYGLSQNIYGNEDQNEIERKTYSGSIAWYVFSTTAIEINYVLSRNTNEQNLSNPENGNYVSQILSEVTTTSSGIGIRQLLAPAKSSFRPMISLGYAKEVNEYSTTYRLTDPTDNSYIELTENPLEQEQDSVFVTLALEIRLSDHFSIRGSASSVFDADESRDWDKNLRYTAGIAIFFF